MKGSIFLVDKLEFFCIHVLVSMPLSFLLNINVLRVLLGASSHSILCFALLTVISALAVRAASHAVLHIFEFHRHDSSHMEPSL